MGSSDTLCTGLIYAYILVFGNKHVEYMQSIHHGMLVWVKGTVTPLTAYFNPFIRACTRDRCCGGYAAQVPLM